MMNRRSLVLMFCLIVPACGGRVELRYEYDQFGFVETASASKRGSTVATARRVNSRPLGGPTLTEIEVEETHFAIGTANVVYKGTMIFHCRTNEPFCERTKVTPILGERRDGFFDRW